MCEFQKSSKLRTRWENRHCIQHSRYMKQDGWRLVDLSLSLKGNIAVTGWNVNTYQTYIDVYTNVRHSDSRDKPKIINSKEFEKYEDEKWIYPYRYVSFIDDDVLVSCLGNKLEVFQVNKDEALRFRRVNGDARCLSVRERREIFIGFLKSNKITVYNVIDLNEIKSIILQGIQDGCWPYDMTAIADRIFVCVGEAKEESNDRSLILEEKNGRILSELTKPTDTVHWYVSSVGVNMNTLGIAAVKWYDSYYKIKEKHRKIVFYSLLNENNCSVLIVEIESGVIRIRIFDRGDRMITGDYRTGEVKVYDMAEVFTYSHFKDKVASTLPTDECAKLANFFKIPKDQTDAILSSETPSENFLHTLAEQGILQPHNVDRLLEAFDVLGTDTFCRHLADIYMKTRSHSYYKGVIKKQEEEMKTLRITSEEERRQLKGKIAEVDDIYNELRTLQEAHQKMTQENNKLKGELEAKQLHISSLNKELQVSKQSYDESQLQLSCLQSELVASKNAKTETENVLKQTQKLLQNIIQEKKEIETELKQCRMERSLESMTLEEERKKQADSGKTASRKVADGSSSKKSPGRSESFPESSVGGEFSKLLVKVSVNLTRTHCILLANYFEFPASKMDILRNDRETPGIEVLNMMREGNIINKTDVTQLQEALTVLNLKDINETLLMPYQDQIDVQKLS